MRLLFLLLSCVGALAQGGAYCTMSTWEPRNLVTKAGLVASYDPGNTNAGVFNPANYAPGNGVSALSNRVTLGTADLLQTTAANQPLITRTDNAGNIFRNSEVFQTTWALTRMNSFGATDTGATGAGSFANTSRTTDPLGGNTADYVQTDGTAALTHFVNQTPIIPAGIELCFSLCAKADGITAVELNMTGGAYGKGFILTNGTMVAVSGDTAPTSSSITSLGSGWYLCNIVFTSEAGTVARIYALTNSAGTYTHAFNGNNTDGLFIWGASLTRTSWTPVTGTSSSLGYVSTTTQSIFPGLSGRPVLYFNGAAFGMKTAAFTLNQPTSIYALLNHWTWTLNDCILDGNTLASGKFYESATSPNLRGNAGTDMTEFVPPPLGTWQVDNIVFDGTSSRISTNAGAFVVSDANTGNMGGFTLGSAATAGTTYWNGLAARVLLCNKTNAAAEDSYMRWGLLKQATLY